MPWYKYFPYKTNQEIATSEGLSPVTVCRVLAARKESAPTLECGEQCPVCKDWAVLIFGVGDQRICKNCASLVHDTEKANQVREYAVDLLSQIEEKEKEIAALRREYEEAGRVVKAHNTVLSLGPEYIESRRAHDAKRVEEHTAKARTADWRECFLLSKTADPYLYSEETAQLADTLTERWRQIMLDSKAGTK